MSSFDVTDSIAAIASPRGSAIRGVVRLSGPGILKPLQDCFHCDRDYAILKQPVVLEGVVQVDPPIERVTARILYWPTTASYTRQPSAEIHCSGALPILDEVMRTLSRLGVRQAMPGEFTMRAFLAGRIDLTRAEAVLGVIDSNSEQEMSVALRQLAGGLSGPIADLQDQLLEVVAHIEAGLDFVEEDIEFISNAQVQGTIDDASELLGSILAQMNNRNLERQVPAVVIFGRPNAGKSRLQNALAEEAQAIVSDTEGTTRDYLSRRIKIGGVDLDLIDTAGTFKDSAKQGDDVQELAESQTDQVLETASLVLFCADGNKALDSWECEQINERKNQANFVIVQTKSDLQPCWEHQDAIAVSSESGVGLQELQSAILGSVMGRADGQTEVVGTTAIRCFESLEKAHTELSNASSWCRMGHGDEVVAASLRAVLDQLAVVTGKVFTDDILDRVFSRFCIGK